MAPAKAGKRFPTSRGVRKIGTQRFETTSAASPFVVLSLRCKKEQLAEFGKTQTDAALEQARQKNGLLDPRSVVAQIAPTTPPAAAHALPETPPPTHPAGPSAEPEEAEMQTRGAWSKNRANPANRQPTPPTARPKAALGSPGRRASGPAPGVRTGKRPAGRQLAPPQPKRQKQNQHVSFDDDVEIIRPQSGEDRELSSSSSSSDDSSDDSSSSSEEEDGSSETGRENRSRRRQQRSKHHHYHPYRRPPPPSSAPSPTSSSSSSSSSSESHLSLDRVSGEHEDDREDSSSSSSSSSSSVDSSDSSDYSDYSESSDTMADPDRPKLKLKMSGLGGAGATPAVQPVQTPVPQSATQRLKLSFGRKPSIVGETIVHKAGSPGVADGGSASKKRKRPSASAAGPPSASGKTGERSKQKVSVTPARKLTFKTGASTSSKSGGAAAASTPGVSGTPVVKIHVKGKIPTRKLGVGYDSENDETERDPVILEGFILRMLPGPDRDYIQESIQNGTIGVNKMQGGANISIRMLDTYGRRGILQVRDNKYATTMVDLPCLVEGIKSWDKKGWIKSIDICQMLLVLGRCRSDEEARDFPLPEGVDPKTHAYAHGITPPMWSVRKRRFDKTKRARVDDIEAVERKVNALLNDDSRAVHSSWEIIDGDPDEDDASGSEQYSGTDEDGESDAEGEHEEPDDYFATQPGQVVATPAELEADADGEIEEDEDLAAEFARAIEEGDGHAAAGASAAADADTGDVSVVATPASASPGAAQVDTPAVVTSDDEDDDEDDDDDSDDDNADNDQDKDEAEKEEDENMRQAKERIAELTAKIKEQKQVLIKTPNAILKRKIASKIQELEKDRRMMMAMAGGGGDGNGDGDDDDAGDNDSGAGVNG